MADDVRCAKIVNGVMAAATIELALNLNDADAAILHRTALFAHRLFDANKGKATDRDIDALKRFVEERVDSSDRASGDPDSELDSLTASDCEPITGTCMHHGVPHTGTLSVKLAVFGGQVKVLIGVADKVFHPIAFISLERLLDLPIGRNFDGKPQ